MRRNTLEDRRKMRSLLLGMLLAAGLALLWCVGIWLLGAILSSSMFSLGIIGSNLMFLTIFGIGIAQVIYLVPLGLYLNHRGKHELVKGMAIGGLITALLNGACFAGVTLTNYSGYGLPTLFFTMLAALIIILCVIILLLLNLK